MGLEVLARVGDRVAHDEPVVRIHARDDAAADQAAAALADAVVVADSEAESPPLVHASVPARTGRGVPGADDRRR